MIQIRFSTKPVLTRRLDREWRLISGFPEGVDFLLAGRAVGFCFLSHDQPGMYRVQPYRAADDDEESGAYVTSVAAAEDWLRGYLGL